MTTYFIAGGAGFIGSHLAREIGKSDDVKIVIYDNFTSGRMWHLDDLIERPNITVVKADIKDLDALTAAMKGADIVYHFASNPDIAKAMVQPDIDFWEGTYLTSNVLEAMRKNGVMRILYASGSGIYGDTGLLEVAEDYTPMLPISTYGASKLACESLICSYCHMCELKASVFRFANVVGPRQTHGVGYDFVRRLLVNPCELSILGDGTQSKSYIHVEDVISAMSLMEKIQEEKYSYHNVATLDHLTVTEIADLAVEVMGFSDVTYKYSGGSRGWKGDVPIVRLSSEKIRNQGWKNVRTACEAMRDSLLSMKRDAQAGRFNGEDKKK
ncbi:MAG: NAD-dependent epimerase/dehydratase family protein [Vulcanimicrobiota bacterium]